MKKINLLLIFCCFALTAAADNDVESKILLQAGEITVTQQDFKQNFILIPKAEQTRILSGADELKSFLSQIYQNKNMVLTAERLKLNENPIIQAQLAASQQRVLNMALREYTLQQIKTPDFAALARERYAVKSSEFQLPEQFKAAHILKKASPCPCERQPARQALERILTELNNGADFAKLATAESEDTGSAQQGGDLGRWFKKDELVAPFAEALVKLEVGQISAIVETQFGFHLIKKLDYQAPRQQTFDEVRENLEKRLRSTYVEDQLTEKSITYYPPSDATFDEQSLQSLLNKSSDSAK